MRIGNTMTSTTRVNFNTLRQRAVIARGIAALLVGGSMLTPFAARTASAQTNNYFTGVGGSTLAGATWSTNVAGPYTSALDTTGGAIINFGNVNTTVTGASITVAGINATANTTISTIGGTISNFNNGVIPITVANGVTLDFSTQAFTTSATAGYTFNGNTSGVLALAGGTYGGGFTLNSGRVVLRGVNALGNGVLNINGGTIAANANRAVTGITQINVGGDFTFGSATAPATTASTISFTAPVALGAATRAITIGGTGTYTLSGVVSGDLGAGLTVNSTAAGTLALNGANTYNGPTTINGGTLTLGDVNALQNTSGITIAGGATLATSTDGITLGVPVTTGLVGTNSNISFSRNSAAVGTLNLNGAIGGAGNVVFTTPNVNSGGNVQTIVLGSAGTYGGNTTITTGNVNNTVFVRAGVANALPVTTVLTLNGGNGTGSGRTVALDLNGFAPVSSLH